MRMTGKTESRERCAESGWYAYDYLFDEPLSPALIMALKPLGSFVYLRMLARPFYKIESDYYIIKGIEGDSFFRVAVHGGYVEQLKKIEDFVCGIVQKDEEKEHKRLKFDKD